jgi:hypothetical protein
MRFLAAAFSRDDRTFPVNVEINPSRRGTLSFCRRFKESIDSGPAELVLPNGEKFDIVVTSPSKVDPQRPHRGICEIEVISRSLASGSL